jgi:hypothetical protein
MQQAASVSIAMATCEGARHVDEQLASLADQSRLPDELVVCDDASQDESAARVEAFARRAPFAVRLVRNPTRLGITANFEQAVRLCGGDVILLADQDDVWHPPKISCLLETLAERPGLGAVFSNGRVVAENGRPLGYDLWQALGFGAREQARVRDDRAHEVFLRHVVAAGTTLAFRARWKPLLLPFPPLWSVHDAWIAFLISAVSEVTCLERELIDYRLHGANQIGLRRFSLAEQLDQARQQLARRAFARQADFFQAARERLRESRESGHPARPDCLAGIEAKIDHCRIRDALPVAFAARLPRVLGELARGRYGRYSYGLKSVAQDLFLRGWAKG